MYPPPLHFLTRMFKILLYMSSFPEAGSVVLLFKDSETAGFWPDEGTAFTVDISILIASLGAAAAFSSAALSATAWTKGAKTLLRFFSYPF